MTIVNLCIQKSRSRAKSWYPVVPNVDLHKSEKFTFVEFAREGKEEERNKQELIILVLERVYCFINPSIALMVILIS